MKEYRVGRVDELKGVATDVLAMLCNVLKGKNGEAAVFALHGDLGSGKTTFMQFLAKELGIQEHVTSPTFVVMKKYDTQHDIVTQLVHIDAYRIEDIDEMKPLRFAEELTQKDTIIGIEWAERIESLLPPETVHMTFNIDGKQRIITVHGKKN